MLTSKLNKTIARKQSKEDKAKYKASLVAFKETYVRKPTSGTTTTELISMHRLKKPRNYYRIYKQKASLAA